MQTPQNEEATWEDIDWGPMTPEPPPEISSQNFAAPDRATLPPESGIIDSVKAEPPVIKKAVDTPLLTRQQTDPEAELARMKSEMLEQLRPMEAHQAGLQKARRMQSLEDDRSAGTKPAQEIVRVVTPASLATLTFSHEGDENAVVTVKDQTTVGRNKENDVVIKDLHVSGRHAKMVSRNDGVFEILDLNSSGGTYVNGEPVQRKELASGDQLVFGTVPAVFKYVAGSQLDDELEYEGTLVEPKADAARKLESLKNEKWRGVLTVLNADGNNTIVHVKSEVTVGRGPDNDLVISDKHVSSNHARLVCSGGGMFEVFDLRSTCGTFVNGAPVKEKLLASGDRIRFGLVECEFQIIETHADGSMNEGAPMEVPPHAPEKGELKPGIKPPRKTADFMAEPTPAAALPKRDAQAPLLKRPGK